MQIHVPGFPVQYIDEEPPKAVVSREGPSVEEAKALALARQTQIINFPGEEKPLIDKEAEAAAKAKADAEAAAEAESVARAAELAKALEAAAAVKTADADLLK
jgi:hypothetical protein